jgi:Tol biopolymer transport system component
VAVVGLVAVALLLSRGTPPTSGAATASPSGPGPVATASGAVVAPSEAPAVSPAPSVPTGEIVFAGDRNGDRDLYVWDAATGQVRLLLKMAGNQTDPSWSPDRSKVVYRDTKAGLRIINADGTPASPPDFTHHAQDLHPAWSPDGSTIVFATNRSPLTSLDIYSRPADDNQVQITSLANSKADDWDPQWSPDGTTIVFASRRQGDAHLFLMNADGSSERLVDLGPGIYDDPTISPDGQWLAFTRRDNAKANKALYIARIDGSDMRRMTNVDVNEHDVSWSPDGRYLAVVRGDQGSRIIVLEVATGAEVTSFGIDGGRALVPDWR